MKSTLSLHSLIHLSNLCDEIAFRQMPEEEPYDPRKDVWSPRSTIKRVVMGAGLATGVGALASGVGHIKRNYGGPGVPFKDSASAAAGDVLNRVKKTKVGNAANAAWRRSSGQNVVKRVGRAAMSGIRSIFHEDMTPAEKIIALDAKLVELAASKEQGQRRPVRGALAGAGTAALTGAALLTPVAVGGYKAARRGITPAVADRVGRRMAHKGVKWAKTGKGKLALAGAAALPVTAAYAASRPKKTA